jgi:hypothetical protein
VRGLSLDLSPRAAQEIGITHKGVARLKVTPIRMPPDAEARPLHTVILDRLMRLLRPSLVGITSAAPRAAVWAGADGGVGTCAEFFFDSADVSEVREAPDWSVQTG